LQNEARKTRVGRGFEMKPRIRSIKPEAHTDEDLWDLEHETGLPLFRAFTGLWCHADRAGRFEWRPRPLKAGILPYWDGDFSRVLDALVSRGFVVRYTVGAREYGLIPNFPKHQFINNKEPPSELPEPPSGVEIHIDTHDNDAMVTRDERVSDASIPSPPFPSVPNNKGGAGGKRGAPPDPLRELFATQWPPDFVPSAENVEFAATGNLSIEDEVANLRDYARKHARISCDWQADLSSWMRKTIKWNREKGSKKRGRQPQSSHGKTGFEGVEVIR
jgi:hypothetical protein